MRKKNSSQSAFSLPRLCAAIALCAGGAWLALLSFAATPPSDTLTLAHNITYTGGPFVAPNATAQAGPVNCTVPMSCDDFHLIVSVPAGTDATKNIKISVGWPISTADFDVYIYSGFPAGALIATAASSSDPEVAIIPAISGDYTIRVVPFAPAGQSYTANVTLQNIPPPPPPPPPGTVPPRYKDYPAPLTLAGAGSAGEPSIGIDWIPKVPGLQHGTVNTGGVAFFTANLNEFRVSFDDCPSPAVNLWEDVTNATESVQTLDPIGFVDHQTGRVFQSQLAGATSITSFSDTDGNSWMQSQGSGQPAGVDHQTLGGGPYNTAALIVPPHPLYANQTYYASQDIGTAFAARSDDGGQTFGPGIPTWNITQCGGLHGHVKVGPDGYVYIPNKSCGALTGVAVSADNGLTWTVRTIPDSSSGSTDPSVGIGADGTVYLGYESADGHPRIAVSHDHGATWSASFDAGFGFIKHAVFAEVVAGDSDRAAFGFLGTTEGNGDCCSGMGIGTFRGVWYFYIATTTNGGGSYSLVDATNGDPVQIGSVCTGGTTCGADRNLLDFNDIQIDKEGRVLAAYADGCVAPTCNAATAASPPDPTAGYTASRSALSTIIRQSGGPRLLSAYDAEANCTDNPLACPPTVPAPPRVDSVVLTGNIVHLAWSEPDNGGSPLTGYKIYRKTGTGGTYALIATVTQNCPACKTSYDDTSIADPTLQYFYEVTALNAVGESAFCGQFPDGLAGPLESACLPPGLTILTDKSNDELDMVPGHDVQSLQISEPFALTPNKIMFTLKVQSLATVPPDTEWPVTFTGPDSVNYTVQMTNSPVDGATTIPIFQVGPTGGTLVAADPASNFTPDGYIRVVVPRSAVGVTANGQQLTGFVSRIAANLVGVTITPDNMPDNVGPAGSYTVIGNAACAPNTAPIAALLAYPVGGTPADAPQGDPPLAIHFDASGSSDPDAGDTIASYTFDFGDGTTPVTQGSAAIDHTYQTNGHFHATVRVTDNHGLVSGNVAGAEIEVELPLDRVVSEKMHGAVTPPFDVILFDTALYPNGDGEIECRTEGTGYTIIYSFGTEFTVTGSASSTPTITNGGTVASHGRGPGTNQYQIRFTGVTNAQRHTITLDGVPVTNGNKANAPATLKNAISSLALLVGDLAPFPAGSGRVDSGDVFLVQQQNGQVLSSANFRADVNASGRIDSGDVFVVTKQNPSSLPATSDAGSGSKQNKRVESK